MGLLDGGIAAEFGAVFGGLYLDAKLYVDTNTPDGRGGWVRSSRVQHDIKIQEDALSEVARAAAGYTAKDARFLVISAVEPTTDFRIFFNGAVYSINPPVDRDPAKSYYALKATRTNESPPDFDAGS